MTTAIRRLVRISAIRGRQQVIASARQAIADAELIGIDGTINRVSVLKRDFAMSATGHSGHLACTIGEFGLRLDSVQDALSLKREIASEHRLDAQKASLAAWQQHRSVSLLHDRAVAINLKAMELRQSIPRLHHLRQKWGGGL